MKRIDAVVRRERFHHVKSALDKVGCPGMMVFSFQGHGRQGGIVEKVHGRRVKIRFVSKILMVIFAANEDAEHIVAAIVKAARTGNIGDGKVFISDIEGAVRIRTGESGLAAI